ncbi:MAG: hydrogenase maturation nickel metallochaperone HypA [Candidatus Baldrarchaeota archaeon]
MHEFSMAQQIFSIVMKVAKENNVKKILEINIEVGQLTFLNPDQLKFALKVLSEDTIAQDAKIRIEIIQPEIRCNSCKYTGKISYDGPESHTIYPIIFLKCPKCGSTDVEIIRGKECNIKNIKAIRKEAT